MVPRVGTGPAESGTFYPILYLSLVVLLAGDPITISSLTGGRSHTDNLIFLRMWGKVIRMKEGGGWGKGSE